MDMDPERGRISSKSGLGTSIYNLQGLKSIGKDGVKETTLTMF